MTTLAKLQNPSEPRRGPEHTDDLLAITRAYAQLDVPSLPCRHWRHEAIMNYKNSSRFARAVFTFLAAAVMAFPALAAEELNFRKNVGNFWVYLAVMPAEIISGPPALEPGATPFQPAAGRDTHHLMVSIFDYRTGRRITDAAVESRVAALGFSGVQKALDNTIAAGAPVYAGLFPMIGRGPFRIDVEFRAPSATGPLHTTFYFTHPSFQPTNPAPTKAR